MLDLQRIITRIKPFHNLSLERAVIQEAARRFQIDVGQLKPVKKLPSAVFNYLDTSYLKITSDSERSFHQLVNIYEWQHRLSEEFGFAMPLNLSTSGNHVEKIFSGQNTYSAILLKAANGIPVNEHNWTPEIYYLLGKVTGQFHQAALHFKSPEKIHEISEGSFRALDMVNKYVSGQEYSLHERCRKITQTVTKLPKGKDNYGLIHNDIHRGNLFIDNDQLTIIDFEEACYSWFINDISNIFYNALMNTWKPFEFSAEYMKSFKSHFWKGYHEHYRLSDADMESLPKWIALRAQYTYAFLLKHGENKTRNNTLSTYFELNQQYACFEMEKIDPGYFID